MKKVFHLFVLFLLFTSSFFAQKHEPINLHDDENKLLNEVFDNYGNKYSLTDIKIVKKERDVQIQNRFVDTTCDSGIFRLHFTSGSGMIDGEHPNAASRRSVICQVFHDISEFINSPLKTNGLNNKVEIWVRDINDLVSSPSTSNVLGIASGFYNLPSSNPPPVVLGGIADNEIWKTIHTGIDSYTNVSFPIIPAGSSTEISGLYYHGLVAMNFHNNTFNWNYDLSNPASSSQIDLYSVVLHEVIHSLGFSSLIDENGNSKFGANRNYFSRYDTYLNNHANNSNLILGNGISPMYDFSYNPALGQDILHPNCAATPPTSSGHQYTINCNTTINFKGNDNVVIPTYTSDCYERPSSFSHFSNQCYTNPNPYGFVMNSGLPLGATRRIIAPEEKNTLCDIGYNLTNQFGNTATLNFFDYGVTNCNGIDVAGVNDGILNNSYQFEYTIGNPPINITGILSNDFGNNLNFEGLQDVYDNAASISSTSGNGSTNISYSSNVPGLHLLRYVPYDTVQQSRGNITYIYVFVYAAGLSCNMTANPCNLVLNGDFEQSNQSVDFISQINRACGWNSGCGTPDYFREDAVSDFVKIPCNYLGYQETNENIGDSYAGFIVQRAIGHQWIESMRTKLATPLLANQNYVISFDISTAEQTHENSSTFQILLNSSGNTLSNNPLANTYLGTNPILLTHPKITNFNNWTRVNITFNSGVGGQEFLYIGGINAAAVVSQEITPQIWTSCNSSMSAIPLADKPSLSYYYVDNISLAPLDSLGKLELPTEICYNESISDLTNFLNPAPLGGTFFGNGVNGNSFDAASAGIGSHIITYKYINNLGCEVIISDTIEVINGCSNCGGISTTWNGTSWSNGIPTLNDDVIINGNYDTTLNGNLHACNLTLNAGWNFFITANHFAEIRNNLTVQPGGNFEIMDDGSLVQINDSGVNTGIISHRRSVMMRRLDYVYWSSPVTGFNTNSISPNTPTSLIWKWNPTNSNSNGTEGNWNNAANETMITGKGYIVRGPSDFPDSSTQEFTSIFNNGVPHNGIINKSISRGTITNLGILTSSDGKSFDRYSDNYNLIGNPYPSSIDAIDFLKHPNNVNIQGRIFLWTHGTLPSNSTASPFYQNFVANYTPSDYITYNQTGSQSGPNTFNGKIASGQGFMVLMEDGPTVPEDGTINVTFNNSMRSSTNDNSNFFRNIVNNDTTINSTESNRIWLDLVNTSNSIDRTLVGYMSEATNSFDRMFDATLIAGNIYSLINSDKMIIQGKALPFNINDEIPLGVKLLSSGEYKIALYAVDGLFEGEQNVYLKDNLLNIYHNLKGAPYAFTSTAGNYDDRFKLVYIAPNTTQLISSQCNTTLPALNTIVYANLVSNAQSYNWMIKNNETNAVYNFTTTGRAFQLTNSFIGFPTNFVNFNSTYTIRVRVKINDVYQAFGNECIITTPNIPITQIQCPSSPLSNIDSYINANINNYATAYRFEVVNLSTNQVGHIDRSLRNFMLTSITYITPSSSTPFAMYNTQYSVKVALLVNGVQGEYSPECIITTPNIPITQIQCPSSPLPNIDSYINANINNYATAYRFEVVNLSTNQVGHIDRSLRNFMLTSITDITPSSSTPFAMYNTQYSVKVALLVNGVQGEYSPECIITTPNIPITQIECPSSLLPTINSYINATINNYATAYRFEVVNLSTNQVGHIDRSLRNFMLTSITDVVPSSSTAFAVYNTQYSVKVALLVNGIQGEYSPECIVETPSTYSKTNNYIDSDFIAVPIPNPFSNEFLIQIKSKSDELITIKVYDMIGKLLDNYVTKTENVGEVQFGRNYPAGFYNVIITQGNNVEKLKIIKK